MGVADVVHAVLRACMDHSNDSLNRLPTTHAISPKERNQY